MLNGPAKGNDNFEEIAYNSTEKPEPVMTKVLNPAITRRLIAVSVGWVSLYVALFAKTRHER